MVVVVVAIVVVVVVVVEVEIFFVVLSSLVDIAGCVFSGITVLFLTKFLQFSSSELSPQLLTPLQSKVVGISPHEHLKVLLVLPEN